MDIFHAMGREAYIRPGEKVLNSPAYGPHLQRSALSAGVAKSFHQKAAAGSVVGEYRRHQA
jgi:hypothetical protein